MLNELKKESNMMSKHIKLTVFLPYLSLMLPQRLELHIIPANTTYKTNIICTYMYLIFKRKKPI